MRNGDVKLQIREFDGTCLRGEVAFKPLGSLPNDGKVIDDTPSYD
jgi:hypothetical protein